jgi:hypothetical protein
MFDSTGLSITLQRYKKIIYKIAKGITLEIEEQKIVNKIIEEKDKK